MLHRRQQQGQFAFRQRDGAAGKAVDDGDGFPPITLAAEHPVPQLEIDLALGDAPENQPVRHRLLGLIDLHAVEAA